MGSITVQPAKDRKVRDPYNHYAVVAEATEVPKNAYWLRRVAQGDVEIVEETKPTKAKK